MSHGLARVRACSLAFAGMVLSSAPLLAQGWNYPSFRHPHVMSREFNFALADGGDAGTTLLFQWREGFAPRTELSLDVGFADPDNADSRFIVGGAFARQLAAATRDMPLDLLLTAGVYAAFGDPTAIRLPVGLAVGHRFLLEGQLALTPYVHPRVSIDFCDGCFEGDDDSELAVNFDIGVDLELSRMLSLRFAALFAGGDGFDDDGFGLSISWKPAPLSPR